MTAKKNPETTSDDVSSPDPAPATTPTQDVPADAQSPVEDGMVELAVVTWDAPVAFSHALLDLLTDQDIDPRAVLSIAVNRAHPSVPDSLALDVVTLDVYGVKVGQVVAVPTLQSVAAELDAAEESGE